MLPRVLDWLLLSQLAQVIAYTANPMGGLVLDGLERHHGGVRRGTVYVAAHMGWLATAGTPGLGFSCGVL
jgi:hypothetical protein